MMTYIEELNYAHNIGYIFIFPIFYLVFTKLIDGEEVPLWRYGLAALLISKPFTAVIVIGLVAFFVWQRTNQTRKLLLFGSYSLAYLGTYMLLPNRWETPFNSDPITIGKAVVNLPWVIFSTLNPLIAIGGWDSRDFWESSYLVSSLVVWFTFHRPSLCFHIGQKHCFRCKNLLCSQRVYF